MNMKAGLFQQQTLKLSMTQELSQAIAILQYSSQELSSFLENKLLENPLLSLEHNSSLPDHAASGRRKSKRMSMSGNKQNFIEQLSGDAPSLEEYLLSQINIGEYTRKQQSIMLEFIRNIDENGYMRIGAGDIAEAHCVPIEEAERCLKAIQRLEPHGIGARNLQECLLIQAEYEDPDSLAKRILEHHFLLFAEKKWKEIAKKERITLKQIQDVFDYVQSLNPRPGSRFYQDKPSYITPDVVVESRDGELYVSHYENGFQELHVNELYLKKMQGHHDKSVNHFLREKWQEYQWISRGIQQRRDTILRVMTKIAECQPDCFHFGLGHLRPMTMKEISDELHIHESTVSRAVKDKYVQTPFGTFEMKTFFTSSLQSANSEDMSGQQAKIGLKRIIANESKLKPLSDLELAELLKDECGILLSRRTVAKYREQLGIPSSSKRKRFE
ncbi:RNA polymerase sigma-54 factor [Bacillus sp. MUM 13]|nr:RNA polymerase factor sigma-54 [Bacillus sp. MUM 13]OIK09110.1 RNA polymerase sigma-54 factor [Bacillus sp. MUM 13]